LKQPTSASPAQSLTVCLPEFPGVEHIGDLPANIKVVWAAADSEAAEPAEPAEPATTEPATTEPAATEPSATNADRVDAARIPTADEVAAMDFVVPLAAVRPSILELLARPSGTGRLQVIQTLSAGVDWLVGHVPPHITVCNARGAFDAPLAEWVVGAILAMERGLLQSRDLEITRTWTPFEPAEVAGRRVVILGFGSIGSAIAARLEPFGVEVIGVARSPREGGDGREAALGLDSLDELLPTAQVLVNMLPLSTETTGLLDARRLALLPDDALVVNGGRGRTIDAIALLRELDAGRLRAVLDVTDPEPLPPESPLWSIPNVLISPHIAGDSAEATVRTFKIAGDQIRRFAAGQELLNQVPRYLLE